MRAEVNSVASTENPRSSSSNLVMKSILKILSERSTIENRNAGTRSPGDNHLVDSDDSFQLVPSVDQKSTCADQHHSTDMDLEVCQYSREIPNCSSKNTMMKDDCSSWCGVSVDHFCRLAEDLYTLQKKNFFCDTVLITTDTQVFAHGVILAAMCPKLCGMLHRDPFNNFRPNVIDLGIYDSSLVEKMLKLFYTGHFDDEDGRLDDLQKLCEHLGVRYFKSNDASSCGSFVGDDAIVETAEWNGSDASDSGLVNNAVASLNAENGFNGSDISDSGSINNAVASLNVADDLIETARWNGSDISDSGLINDPVASLNVSVENLASDNSSVDRKATEIDSIDADTLEGQNRSSQSSQKPAFSFESLVVVGMCATEPRLGNTVSQGDRVKLFPIGNRIVDPSDRNRSGRRTLACRLCKQEFTDGQSILKHTSVHGGISGNDSQCCVCGKTYEVKEKLQRHLVQHFRKYLMEYECSICHRGFHKLSRLRSHMNLHTSEKPCVCPHCERRFTDNYYLSRHLLVHKSGKKFLCTNCGKGFITNYSLNIHMKQLHTGEKPFVCQMCGWKFAQATSLQVHIHKHTKGKPYGCSICKRRFAVMQKLKMHILTRHTADRDKPFHCPICAKGFAKKFLLRQHQLTHEKREICKYCEKGFISANKLERHLPSCSQNS